MHLNMNSARRCSKLSWLGLAQASLVTAAYCAGFGITVPNEFFNRIGNSASELPFDTGTNSIRYQQVFDASQFGQIGPGGAVITMLSFNVAASGQGFDTTLPSIRIDLSTTTKLPDALSPTFADNVGADDAIVFGTGPLSIRAGGPAGGAFDIHVPLARPFFYLPSAGNLLLDVRNFGGGNTTFFDGVFTVGDSVSMVYGTPADGSGSVNSSDGRLNTFGLITRFEGTLVPEPAPLLLLILGLCAVALAARRRKAGWRT